MKKIFFTLLPVFLGITYLPAQVGLNTNAPEATLDIVGSASLTAEGLLMPNYTADELNSKNAAYGSDQNGTLVFVSSGMGYEGTKTEQIFSQGFYYYNAPDGKWKLVGEEDWISDNYGDIKESITESIDHDGWIMLDGRPISSLTAGQQVQAATLGLTGNLPDAANSVLAPNGTSLGSVSGSNTKMIERSNLPEIILTGITNTTGEHTHSSDDGSSNQSIRPNSSLSTNRKAQTLPQDTLPSGDHTHSFTTESLNGGVSQQPIDMTPKSMSVNMFIYLGD